MSEYSEGICGDGVAILKDGTMMTPDEIVADLRRIQQLEAELEQTKKDLDHMASMHHAQEMKYLKAQSKVNALVEEPT